MYHTTKGAGDSGPTLVQYARAIVVSMQRNEPCCCNNNPIAGTHSLTWSSASPYQKRLPPPSFEAAAVRDEAVEKATMVKEFSKVENDL